METKSISLKMVELHSAIRFSGKTESNITLTKLKGVVRSLKWIPGPFLEITTKDEVHLLPAAAVKDSIVLIEPKAPAKPGH